MITMGLTDSAYELYFAPNFSKIYNCDFPTLSEKSNRNFVQEYFAKSIFWQEFDGDKKHLMYYYLRRVQQIIKLFNATQISFLDLSSKQEHRLNLYLESLNNLEIIVMLIYQNFNLVKALLDKDIFKKNDNTPFERLNKCYNRIKHFDKSVMTEFCLQTSFLDKDRFCVLKSYVTFEELRIMIEDQIEIACKILRDKQSLNV